MTSGCRRLDRTRPLRAREPTDAVYAQPARSELRLITCGGEYDEASNRYLENVIVWAKATDVRGSTAS